MLKPPKVDLWRPEVTHRQMCSVAGRSYHIVGKKKKRIVVLVSHVRKGTGENLSNYNNASFTASWEEIIREISLECSQAKSRPDAPYNDKIKGMINWYCIFTKKGRLFAFLLQVVARKRDVLTTLRTTSLRNVVVRCYSKQSDAKT